MLTSILSRSKCAECRICCEFDSYDLWETPVITPEVEEKIASEVLPQQEFIQKGNCKLLKLRREENEDLYYCTLLSEEGCKLGINKPFDCQIWPFRIMDFNSRRVISISPVCPSLYEKSLKELVECAKKISPIIFETADKYPEIVKPYMIGYPILYVENN